MSYSYSSFIRIGRNDLTLATPRLFLKAKARPKLSLTLPYQIEFTLRRAKRDGSDRPCIVKWSPAADGISSLVLLRHIDDDSDHLERLAVSEILKTSEEENSVVVANGQDTSSLWELPPGGSVRLVAKLPESYYRALKAGDSTYTLLYPGGEVAIWEWGTIQENLGRELKARRLMSEEKKKLLPSLVIPGGARISFTARAEEPRWPEREAYEARNGFNAANVAEREWRLELGVKTMRLREGDPEPLGREDRVPGAPILSVSVALECAPTVKLKGVFDVAVKVTYEGVCGLDADGKRTTQTATRPILFRAWSVLALEEDPREGFRLYRRLSMNDNSVNNDPWEMCDLDDGSVGFMIVDAPDKAARVTEHAHFMSLRPGESWTTFNRLQGKNWSLLPNNTAPGDVYCYGFNGAVVDWWDWGGPEDHADTVVMLPCWEAGRVVDPADNRGRQKLVVTASEGVIFKVME